MPPTDFARLYDEARGGDFRIFCLPDRDEATTGDLMHELLHQPCPAIRSCGKTSATKGRCCLLGSVHNAPPRLHPPPRTRKKNHAASGWRRRVSLLQRRIQYGTGLRQRFDRGTGRIAAEQRVVVQSQQWEGWRFAAIAGGAVICPPNTAASRYRYA